MADLFHSHSRSSRLDRVLSDLLGQAPELQAAAVVSFDGLPMASALPVGMDEDRVAAMSAALLSLGERAAENFGRGSLNQVYVEGDNGTVFLVSADDEAVLVAVGAKGAKVGLLMFEVRRSAAAVAHALRADDAAAAPAPEAPPELAELTELVEPGLPSLPSEPSEYSQPSEYSEPAVDPLTPAALVTNSYLAQPPAPQWQAEEVPAAAPALHVVESVEPEPYLYPAPVSSPEPEPVYEQPYAPYAEQVEPAAPVLPPAPAGPLSPWGAPLGGVGEANGWPKPDPGNWTNYAPGQIPPAQPGGADSWS